MPEGTACEERAALEPAVEPGSESERVVPPDVELAADPLGRLDEPPPPPPQPRSERTIDAAKTRPKTRCSFTRKDLPRAFHDAYRANMRPLKCALCPRSIPNRRLTRF